MSYDQALLFVCALMFAAFVAGMLAGIALFAWLDAAAERERRRFVEGPLLGHPAWPRRPR